MTGNRLAFGALVVLVAGLVAAVPLTGSVAVMQAANQQSTGASSVDSCTAITEPGHYELEGDLDGDDGVCLHVQASDVVLDGNGHAIAGSDADDSVGLLVYGAARGEPVDGEDALDNVTVRDVAATNWARGVQVGDVGGVGTTAALENVTARDNGAAGVYLVETEDALVDGLETSGSVHGAVLWEVQDSTLRGITATGNDNVGVALYQDVYGVTIRDVTATGNGNGGYASGGVYLSTDARENLVADARLADNDGAGARFSDSGENVLRDAVVESNDGPGVHGVPAGDELLRNVTARGNGGPALHLSEGRLSADGLDVDGVATVTFEDEPVSLEPADASALPEPADGTVVTDRGLNATNVDDGVSVTVDVGDSPAELWRFDGSEWASVPDTAYDVENGTVTGTVTADGIVAPVLTEDADDGGDAVGGTTTTTPTTTTPTTTTPTTTTSTITTSTTTPTTTTPTTTTPTTTRTEEPPTTDDAGGGASTLVVSSTRADHDFGYILVVDGDVERTATDDVAADSSDRIIDGGDGTMTVVGGTGDRSGDAFRVDGEVTAFYTPAAPGDYVLELDGEVVTDDLPRPGE